MTPLRTYADGPHFTAEIDLTSGGLALYGELDMCSAELLVEAGELLKSRAPACAHVSVAGLQFIDAAGIGALVRLRNELAEIGVPLEISHARGGLARVFRLAGSATLLVVRPADAV